MILRGHESYQEAYDAKCEIVAANAKRFNDDCDTFDLVPDDIDENAMLSVWDFAAPSICQEDAATQPSGYKTLQKIDNEEPTETIIQMDKSHKTQDPLLKLYTATTKHQHMSFGDYCKNMHSLNEEQKHIVMFNQLWCKDYINALKTCKWKEPYRIFISGPGGTGKSFIVNMIHHDIYYFLKNVIWAEDDQPLVLKTAPTGSAAFQIGGSTIHSAFLLHDKARSKVSWEKYTIRQLKLENLMLSLTDEISMVGFKKFQQMNEMMCHVKGTSKGDWGGICVIAMGDLYQLPPIGECPTYTTPKTLTH